MSQQQRRNNYKIDMKPKPGPICTISSDLVSLEDIFRRTSKKTLRLCSNFTVSSIVCAINSGTLCKHTVLNVLKF